MKFTLVLFLTVVMCVASGAIALERKLQSADPADIF